MQSNTQQTMRISKRIISLAFSFVLLFINACSQHMVVEHTANTTQNNSSVNNNLLSHATFSKTRKSLTQDLARHQVRGKVLASNEKTPVVGATVYIATRTNITKQTIADLGLSSSSLGKKPSATIANQCKKPLEPFLTYTCTDKNGHFALDINNIPSLPIPLKISKRNSTVRLTLAINDLGTHIGNVTLPNYPQRFRTRSKVAIVSDIPTGIDFIGQVNSSLKLISENGTTTFSKIQKHNKELPFDPAKAKVDFPALKHLLIDQDGDEIADINNYDVVYVSNLSSKLFIQLPLEVKKIFLEFVGRGGKLYFTSKNKLPLLNGAQLDEFI